MNPNSFRPKSLKTRVSLMTLAIFLTTIWLLAYYVSHELRADMENLLSKQQAGTAAIVAASINDDLKLRFDELERTATTIARFMRNSAELQGKLERRAQLMSLFNAGAFITGPDGIAIASVPASQQRIGVNYLLRDHIAAALHEGRATVSEPTIGKVPGIPMIALSMPIRDRQGKVIGALSGNVDLSEPNFLDIIADKSHLKSGELLLAAPRHRIFVASSDKRRIMERFPAPGISPLIDKRQQGYEGTEVFVNPLGVEVLSTAKGIPTAGWYVVATLPIAEAFAPVRAMLWRMALATGFLSLLAAVMTWWVLSRQLAPLSAAAEYLKRMGSDNTFHALPIVRQDEIGELVRGFNHLLEILMNRELALRKLSQAVEQSPESIVITNLAAEIEYVNAAFVHVTGFQREEVIGRNPRILQSGRTPAETYIGLWNTLNRGDIWEGELINKRKDGREYIEFAIIAPIRTEDGQVAHFVAVKQDITERFHREREHRNLEMQLRQSQKMEILGQLTGGIAHDFNNILALVLGYTELMQMEPAIRKNQHLGGYVQEIVQAGIRAKELVIQLLTFSGQREVVTTPSKFKPVLVEVVKLLQSTLPSSISISSSFADDLPEVLLSPVQMHQIIMNLGVNARDALHDRHYKGNIEIKAEKIGISDLATCSSCHCNFSGSYMMISVRDDGVGIAREHLEKIFDPFFTTKEVGKGSGLGLSVLHGIVHSASGHVQVLSTLGKGTEFRVYLPAQPRESVIPEGDDTTDKKQISIRGHVMVVDDEPSIVGFMAAQLERIGCRVTSLTSSPEALRMFRADPQGYDMVITDQTMPDLTGAELASAMLACRADIPIVLITGYTNAINEKTAYEIGIRRFLNKPVSARTLADVVVKYVAGKNSQ